MRTGRRDLQRVEILSGLTAGDLVVGNSSEGKPGPVVAVQAKEDAARQAANPPEEEETGMFE